MVTGRLDGDDRTNAAAVRGRPHDLLAGEKISTAANVISDLISTAANVVSDMIARVAFDWGGQKASQKGRRDVAPLQPLDLEASLSVLSGLHVDFLPKSGEV
jgi:hypothetical protein